MKRKKSEFELAMEADKNAFEQALKADKTAFKRALEIPGWSQADVNKSVNWFMTEQKQRKPREPIRKGLAMRLMARAQGKCENCRKPLFNEKYEIHHKNYAPTDNRETNLMVVCKNCHKKMTGPRPVM